MPVAYRLVVGTPILSLLMEAGAGAYVYAGGDANLQYDGTPTLTADTGAYAIAGQEATLTHSGGLPADVVLHMDWEEEALGSTSDAACRNTSKNVPWSLRVGVSGWLSSVQSATGRDFPSSKVFQVVSDDTAQNLRIENDDEIIPVPGVGESLFYRWYYRGTHPASATTDDANHHSIQDGQSGSLCNWIFRTEENYDGTYNVYWEFDANLVNAWPNAGFDRAGFPCDETFRFELQIHRIGTSTFNAHVRVYDSADVLLYDDDDFENRNGSQTLGDTPTLNFNNVANLAGFQIGLNGVSGPALATPVHYSDQGCVMVRTANWCGPYNASLEAVP